jgi:murein DD-endopeptidase MepM/ murein hydrolase activator NlpD
MAITATSSPLTTAANNIVKIGLRSRNSLPRAQSEFESFSRFLTKERMEIEAIELPSQKKVKELANKNIVSNFGSVGNLLKNLLGGAFDLGNFISGFFPGKGEKIGKTPSKSKPQPRSRILGNKLNIGGIRALGIVNTVFAGLDFATGLAQGEGAGKAGAGAAGSLAGGLVGGALAGSLLSGATGQALIPVPGLGFLIGAAVGGLGSFLGGYAADRVYEGITGGDVKKKQEEELKKSSQRLRAGSKLGGGFGGFDIVLMEFNKSIEKFEDLAMNIGNFIFGPPPMDDNTGDVKTDFTMDGGSSAAPTSGEVVSAEGGDSPSGHFTSGYGWRWGRMHNGVDFAHPNNNSPISILQPGIVDVGYEKDYGNWVAVKHDNGAETLYAHLSKVLVNKGQRISTGTVIGNQGSTGRSTGPHVHFEYRPGGPGTARVDGRSVASNYFRFGGNVKVNKVNPSDSMYKLEPVSTSYQNQTQSTPTPITSSSPTPIIPTQPRPTTTTPPTPTQPRPVMQSLPQNVMVAPPKEQPKIQSYPSYSQGQSYILERQTIIATGTNSSGQRQAPVVVPVGGGGGSAPAMIVNSGPSLNSLMKNILLTSLSSS